jgi:aryl-alcohol dehydrogenase-like predicted oxidoreductase
VEQRKFGRTNAAVPVVGMGTWKTFDVRGEAVERDRHAILDEAVEADATFVDSSPMYGEAERVLGDAVRPIRDRVVVATKVWTPSPDEGQRQIERALRHFGGRVESYPSEQEQSGVPVEARPGGYLLAHGERVRR